MPSTRKDALFDLITSLTKAEKRNFRIYAKKIQSKGTTLFMRLFDDLDKQENYDVNKLLETGNYVNKSQIANLKRQLYQHILTSLRLLYSQKQIELQIREFLDYAEILYNKGLYLQALKILARAKKIAEKNHQSILNLEIITFEARIESRHITRSSTKRMSDLMKASALNSETIGNLSRLSNLKLYLQRVFINHGHLQENSPIFKDSQQYFKETISIYEDQKASFFEKVFYYQSYYWYYFLTQHFEQCHHYAQLWLRLYEQEKNMIIVDVNMYLRAVHHYLNTTFFIKNASLLAYHLKEYNAFLAKNAINLNQNADIQAHLFLYQAQFNYYFLTKTYQNGLLLIPKVLDFIKNYEYQLDNYKVMILYYKIASCYLGAGKPNEAIDFVNNIINQSSSALREDILLYSRLLGVLAYYELKNLPALEYLIAAIDRQIANQNTSYQLGRIVINCIKKLIKAVSSKHDAVLQNCRADLQNLSQQPQEQRAFIFLDASDWIARQLERR